MTGRRQHSIDTYPVRVVITGIEHSGTTILSLLLKQSPRLASAFECGFLLADRPEHFKDVHPWYEWMQEPLEDYRWAVSAENMDRICSAKSWEEAYRRLVKYSPVFDGEQIQQVVDKTPRYLSCLDEVLEKLPEVIPCLVIEKDIESLWLSHKRRKLTLENFCSNFELYNNGLRRALRKHGERIHRIQYDALCNQLDDQLRKIFALVELPYTKEYLSKYQSAMKNYFQQQKLKAEPLSAEEIFQLNRLKREFADLQW